MHALRHALVLALAILPGALQSQDARTPPTVLGLRVEETDVPKEIEGIGLLYREVIRQALLIAGREGMGLSTRDQALREPLPDASGTLSLHVVVNRTRVVQLALTQGVDKEGPKIWEHSFTLPPGSPCSVQGLLPLLEPLSRGAMVEALKKAGFSGKPVAAAPAEAVPAEADRRLRELTFTEAYAALRLLHAACRESGESPDRLGALVRAYANLGQLSRGLWNATPKIFAARALLYAERLVAAASGTRTALWHRAYAYTMAGIPKAALEDLASAVKIEDSKEAEPAWVAWIAACCRKDTPALAKEAPREDLPLKRFLGYLTVEGSGSAAFERAKLVEALEPNPDCYRLVDALCAIGGISNLHQATVLGPGILQNRIYARVDRQPELPKRVRDTLGAIRNAASEAEARVKVWNSLIASTEAVEPSWPLLGRMIEETTFMQTIRRGDFMKHQWGVECDEFIQEVAPLVKEHPYGALVRTYGLDYARQSAEWNALFEKLVVVDAVESLLPLATATWKLQPNPVGRNLWASLWRHLDATGPDLEWVLRRVNSAKEIDNGRKFSKYLIELSPYSPLAAATQVDLDWAGVAPRAAELEKSLGHHPALLHALGRKYQALQRGEDAERCFKKEVAIAPGLEASRALAEIYMGRGDEDKWVATLEEFLGSEDVGLEHAMVRVELAEHFMRFKKFAKAEPYAAAAAESWAAWAMQCARDCYEGLEDWKKAELWQQRCSERYFDQKMDWFFWCKRTRRGNVAGAGELAADYIRELLPRATGDDRAKMGIYYILVGKPAEALSNFQKAQEQTNNPYNGLHAALLAMSVKDVEARDAAFLRVIQKGGAYESANGKGVEVELAKEFRDLLELGPGSAPNPGVFDRILSRAASEGHRANAAYFVGRFLELHRSPAEAKPYFEQCIKTGLTIKWTYLLSTAALQREF